MATARAILIVGWLLLAWVGGAAAGERCVGCHVVHYVARGTCTSCHRGDPAAVRVALAHHRLLRGAAAAWRQAESMAVNRGVVLRDSLGCRRCHVSGARGERLAINLDTVVWQRTQTELGAALTRPAFGMPDFHLAADQADTLIAVLLRDGDQNPGDGRYQVRFSLIGADSLDVFAHLCGDCHVALGAKGPQGFGTSGPNLSGLLGEYYPTGGEARWDRERLTRWLENPRLLRPLTTMPPLVVTTADLDALVQILAPSGAVH